MTIELDELPRYKGMPVPFTASQHEDGTPNFTLADPIKTDRCAKERLCAVCGGKLGYWLCFVGGPRAAASRSYSDGPMHEECADAAMLVCPFIFKPKTNRASEKRVPGLKPDGYVPGKPDTWVMFVTRNYTYARHVFTPAPAKRLRTFHYVDGQLTEDGT